MWALAQVLLGPWADQSSSPKFASCQQWPDMSVIVPDAGQGIVSVPDRRF